MPVNLQTESVETIRKTYKHRAEGDPTVEVNLIVNQPSGVAGLRIQVSGASGAAQLVQVLQIISNKIKADFGL